MKKWEYRIIDTKEVPCGGTFKGKRREAVEAYLNNLGEQGWEIVTIDALVWTGWLSALLLARVGLGCLGFVGVARRERQ